MGSYGQWIKWGFLAGVAWAIVANPVGCLIWLGILAVVLLVTGIVAGYAIMQMPILLPILVVVIAGGWLLAANWPRRERGSDGEQST